MYFKRLTYDEVWKELLAETDVEPESYSAFKRHNFSCSRHHDRTPCCAGGGSALRTAAIHRPCHWRTRHVLVSAICVTKCLVETFRGEKNVWNAAMGGCVTGAAMSAKQGPQAMAFGCGGFGTFSLVADQVMESMDMH
jgi:hypothetical protein